MRKLLTLLLSMGIAVCADAQKRVLPIVGKAIYDTHRAVENVLNRTVPRTYPHVAPWVEHPIPVGRIGQKKENLHRVDTLSHAIKGQTERLRKMETRLRKERRFNSAKEKLFAGELDGDTEALLSLACEAEERNAYDVMMVCCVVAAENGPVAPEILLAHKPKGATLRDCWKDFSRFTISSGYISRMNGDSLLTFPLSSEERKAYADKMTLVRTYAPALTPLVKIEYAPDLANTTELYREAADSIIRHRSNYLSPVDQHVCLSLMHKLVAEERHRDIIEYFEQEPLRQYVDTSGTYLLQMVSSSIVCGDDERANSYLGRAYEVDSARAYQYMSEIYNSVLNDCFEHPENTELVEWLIAGSEDPAACIDVLFSEWFERYLRDADEDNWEWMHISDMAPQTSIAYNACIFVAKKRLLLLDEGTDKLTFYTWNYVYPAMAMYDPSQEAEATRTLQALNIQLSRETDPALNNLKCAMTMGMACIAGHGWDRPMDALKVLKKNLKTMQKMSGVEPETRADYYSYMAALYGKLGKAKDAAKYRDLREKAKADGRPVY